MREMSAANVNALAVIIAAIVAGVFSVAVAVIGRRTKALATKLETGNGEVIGPVIHRIDQDQEMILANQRLQMDTLAQHGAKLIDLMARQSELADHQCDYAAQLSAMEEVQKQTRALLADHLESREGP